MQEVRYAGQICPPGDPGRRSRKGQLRAGFCSRRDRFAVNNPAVKFIAGPGLFKS